jgi:hypothetical protein
METGHGMYKVGRSGRVGIVMSKWRKGGYVMLCYVMLYYVILCYNILYHIMLSYAVQQCVILHHSMTGRSFSSARTS